jgi:phage gpG-like protein
VIAAYILGGRDAAERVASLSDRVRSAIERAVGELGGELRQSVQTKLFGQVLQRRSGALVASIAAAVEDSGETISATVGSDLPYAHAQEYGFDGIVGVRSHLRRITMAFGRPIGVRTVAVAAYSRRMDLPERSFLRSALAEVQGEIAATVEAAVERAVRE